jgi:hypothetical protein
LGKRVSVKRCTSCRGCFKYAKPDEKLRFAPTTTSKAAQERLGLKK